MNVLRHISGLNGLPTEVERFSNAANLQAERIINGGINDQAVNRRLEKGITIDGKFSQDLDDGINIEKTNSGGYVLKVSISDVSEAIDYGTEIDLEALKRMETIYDGSEIKSPMIPTVLSNGLLSLNQNGDKLTLTIKIEYDSELNIVSREIYPSRFRNMRSYSHEEYILDSQNPESDYFSMIGILTEFHIKNMLKSQNRGATDIHDIDYKLGETRFADKQAISQYCHSMIQTCMVEANISAFELARSRRGGDLILCKRHDKKNERAYFSTEAGYHKGLEVNGYTNFTSPLRRYMDVIMHRILQLVVFGRDDIGDYLTRELKPIVRWHGLRESQLQEQENTEKYQNNSKN